MTFKQIYENIAMDFPNYLETTIAIDVGNIYRDFCFKTGLPRKKYNLALTTASYYTLAAGVNRVYDVAVLNSNSELIDDISYTIDNGIIYFYDTYGGKLTSMPSTVSTVSIYYHGAPSTSSDLSSASPDLPVQFHNALIEGVEAKYYRRAKDFQNAVFAKQAYAEYIADGKKYCNINGLVKHDVMPDTILNTDWASGISAISGGSGGGTVTVGGATIPYGTTAERPTLTSADIGYVYFDTTISSPIWWNGTEWV